LKSGALAGNVVEMTGGTPTLTEELDTADRLTSVDEVPLVTSGTTVTDKIDVMVTETDDELSKVVEDVIGMSMSIEDVAMLVAVDSVLPELMALPDAESQRPYSD